VRRLIRPGRTDNVLVVGAGELARSLWPFFRQHTTGAWNRRDLAGRLPAWIRPFGPDAGARAARWAQHVILATPPDTRNDGRWAHWLAQAAPRLSVIIERRLWRQGVTAGR